MKYHVRYSFSICFLLFFLHVCVAQRQMENLGRGVVAVRNENGNVFVSWRLLGTEPEALAFNIYRSNNVNKNLLRLNKQPITLITHFIDTTAQLSTAYEYVVKPLLKGKE